MPVYNPQLNLIKEFIGGYAGTANSEQSNSGPFEYSEYVEAITQASFLEPKEKLACLNLIRNTSRRDFLYYLDGINQKVSNDNQQANRQDVVLFNQCMLLLHSLIHNHMIQKLPGTPANALSAWFDAIRDPQTTSLDEIQQACQSRFDQCIQKFKVDHNLLTNDLTPIQEKFKQSGVKHIQSDASTNNVPEWLAQVSTSFCADHHHFLLDKPLTINNRLIDSARQYQDIRLVEELTDRVLNPDQSNIAVVLDEDASIKNDLLLAAHECKSMQTVNKLLAHGADVNRLKEPGKPLVNLLINCGYHEGIKQLNAEQVNEYYGEISPYFAAFEENNIKTLEALLNHDHAPSMNDVDIGKYLARNHMPAFNIILEAMNNKPDLSSSKALVGFAMALKGENISTFDVIKTMKSEVRRLVEHNLYEGLAYCSTKQLQTSGLLEEAVRLGHIETAQVLIGQGAEVNGSYLWGASPLQLAQQHSDLRLTRLLLKAGADSQDLSNDTINKLFPNNTEQTLHPIDLVRANLSRALVDCSDDELNQPINNHGQTLLHEAAKYGYLECAQLLVNQGLDIEARNGREQTPLHFAAKYGHSHIVKFLLQQGANYEAKDNHDLKPVDNHEQTLLYEALKYGHLECVRLLINQGVDIEIRDDFQRTPLHLAAQYGHSHIVKFLLQQGANYEAKNKYNLKPVNLARMHNNNLVYRRLLVLANLDCQRPSGQPLACHVIQTNYAEQLENLKLEELTKKNISNENALDYAIGMNNTEALEILLSRAGPGVQQIDRQKPRSALHYAVGKSNNKELMGLLIGYGWDVNSKQDHIFQSTPLHRAAFLGNRAAVQCLLENGADPNIQDNRNQKPRDIAKNLGVVQLIDDYRQQMTADGQANREGSNASLSDNNFVSETRGEDNHDLKPIGLAEKNNHSSVCQRLKSTAKIYDLQNDPNKPSWQPLVCYAVQRGFAKQLENLKLEELTNEDELTHRNALDEAIYSENSQALEILLKRAGSTFQRMDKQKSSSAVYYAVEASNNKKLIELLIGYGWDINSRQDRPLQRTPLHRAAFWGNHAAVQCLLENGADPNIQDNRNQKPRDLATNQDIAHLIDYRQQMIADSQANRESNKASLSGNIFFASGVVPPPEPTEEELDRVIGQLD